LSQQPSSRKKWLRLGIKLLIAAAVVWWVQDTITKGWAELKEQDAGWDWQPAWLAAAAAIYLVGLMPFCLFWRRVLQTLGQDARLGPTIRAYYIGHLGKYVPGKAMVVVIRTALIRGGGVNTAVAAVSVFLETLTMMGVGAFLAAAYLLLFFREEPLWTAAAAGLMAVSLMPTLPPVFRRIVRVLRIGKSDPAAAERLQRLGFGTLAVGWLLSLLGWLLLALSYWATLRAMGIEGVDPIADLPRYVAAVSLAVVAGFLLLVLPGGVGVREAFLVRLMLPYLRGLGPETAHAAAWASALLLRLVWTGSEALISAGLWLWKPAEETPPKRDGCGDE